MKIWLKYVKNVFLLIMITLFVSCKGSVDSNQSETKQNFGAVCINFSGGNERTVLPSEIDISKLFYKLEFTKADNSESIFETQNGAESCTFELSVGTWDLEIKGFYSENDASDSSKALVSYSQTGITISYGNNVTINAKLIPYLENLTQNGSGSLRYNIHFPEGTAGVLKIYNYPDKQLVGEPIVFSATENSGSVELLSGYYDLSVSYEYQGKIKIWSEIIHIYDNAITEISITSDDFTDYLPPPGPVDVYLSMDKFTMTDEGKGVFDGMEPIILFATDESCKTIAVEELVVVSWQVGDVLLGTGSSVDLNPSLFPEGEYNLSLVFIKDDKVWQGNISFEVVGTILYVTDTNQWENALSTIRNGGSNKGHIIVVNGDVGIPGIEDSITENTGFGSHNSNISVLLKGSGKLFLNSNGSIMRLGNGHTLIIDSEDLILEGLTSGQNGFEQDNTQPLLFVQDNGNLILKSGLITGNTNPNTNYGYGGGGVYVAGKGLFTMTGGKIYNNSTGSWNWGSGVYLWEEGTFEMTGGAISDNAGQGVVVYGNFTMAGDSSISGHIGSSGVSVAGGIGGTFIMKDNASIYGNTEDGNGGGGVSVGRGTFIMEDNASIYDNSITADNISPIGGGVAVWGDGIFTMKGNASIHDNDSTYCGGGVGIRENGILIMEDNASIWGNTAYTGAGVSVGRGDDAVGTLIMRNNASIHTNNSSSFGGGVKISSNGTLTMLDDSSIYGNISDDWGAGGVYVGSNGTFTMKNTSSVYGNTSNASSYGGGVSISGGTFIMQDDTSIHSNIAREGGGIELDSGTFIMSDNASIYSNSAKGSVSLNSGFGGGVQVSSGSFTMTGGVIHGNSSNEMSNTASNNGAALYLNPNGTVICQYGTFYNDVWNPVDNLATTNDTIIIINGQLQ